MSFEDKRQLSFKMNLLTSKKLGKVVEVIYSRHPDLIQVVRLTHPTRNWLTAAERRHRRG